MFFHFTYLFIEALVYSVHVGISTVAQCGESQLRVKNNLKEILITYFLFSTNGENLLNNPKGIFLEDLLSPSAALLLL